MSQEEMDECWKKLAEWVEEEVLDKYKVEDNKRGAYRDRGSFFGIEGVCVEAGSAEYESGEKIVGQ